MKTKTKTNKVKTLFLVAAVCLLSASTNAQQLEFKEAALVLVQKIALTTTYTDLIQMLESNKVEIEKRKDKNRTESITFTLGQKKFNALYSKDKKLIYVCTYPASMFDGRYPSFSSIVDDLEKNNFKGYEKPEASDDYTSLVVSVRYFDKVGYPYQIIMKSFSKGSTYIYFFDKKFGSIDQFTSL